MSLCSRYILGNVVMSDNINNDQGQGNTEYDAGHKDNDILSKRSKTLDHYITKLAALREKSFSRYHVLLPEVIKELKHQKIPISKRELEKQVSKYILDHRIAGDGNGNTD